jgi:hypothetical protein
MYNSLSIDAHILDVAPPMAKGVELGSLRSLTPTLTATRCKYVLAIQRLELTKKRFMMCVNVLFILFGCFENYNGFQLLFTVCCIYLPSI